MKVKIPFKPRFKEPMLNGQKTWTSRTRPLGKRGDIFEVFGHQFQIEKVERRTLQDIFNSHWKEEGCEDPVDFFEIWEKIHPVKGFVPIQRVYVHVFKLLEEDAKKTP